LAFLGLRFLLSDLYTVASFDVGDLYHHFVKIILVDKLWDDVCLDVKRLERLEHKQTSGLVDGCNNTVLDSSVMRRQFASPDDADSGNRLSLDVKTVDVLLSGVSMQDRVPN
jgi:hypothetical protein